MVSIDLIEAHKSAVLAHRAGVAAFMNKVADSFRFHYPASSELGLVSRVIREIEERAKAHDESKLHEPELSTFAELTPLMAKTEYGSPEYKEQLRQLGPALNHHYHFNEHHPEHYAQGIVEMTFPCLIEMFADWAHAVTRTKGGDIHVSIAQNMKRFGYGAQFASRLHNLQDAIEGQEEPILVALLARTAFAVDKAVLLGVNLGVALDKLGVGTWDGVPDELTQTILRNTVLSYVNKDYGGGSEPA